MERLSCQGVTAPISPKTNEEILSQTLHYQLAVRFICDSMSIKRLLPLLPLPLPPLLLHTVSSRRAQGVLMMLHVSWVSKEENVGPDFMRT